MEITSLFFHSSQKAYHVAGAGENHTALRRDLSSNLFMAKMNILSRGASLLLLGAMLAVTASAQRTGPTSEALTVKTTSLPRAFLRREFDYPLKAEGGTQPLRWQVDKGDLPAGMELRADGLLAGMPTGAGEFHFTVRVSDGSRPALEKTQELVLRVVAPLLAQWEHAPSVVGRRLEGSVKLSNQTEEDFDLTFVVLAVNETGRATAIGYQRFALNKDTVDFEVPFGESMPPGSYEIDADVVGEVPSTNSIYRSHLVAKERLQIVGEP